MMNRYQLNKQSDMVGKNVVSTWNFGSEMAEMI